MGLATLGTVKNRANAAITAGAAVALWTPASGKRYVLLEGQLSLSVAGQIILKDGSTELLRSPQLAAGGVWELRLSRALQGSAVDVVLNVDVSATGSVGGWVGGEEV